MTHVRCSAAVSKGGFDLRRRLVHAQAFGVAAIAEAGRVKTVESRVTCHAALALGLGATHGTLKLGKVADFALWDIDEAAELAYALGANPCAGVVRGGRVDA